MFLYCVVIILTTFTCAVKTHDTCRRIDSGWVCGAVRDAEDGVQYISFRGIPYARQPVDELRFKELQPVIPWTHYMNATEEGPICPQFEEFFGLMVNPQKGMSEACIFVNVHVPISPPTNACQRLPIFVFIHEGGLQSGSGDSDLYGPEYLVSKGIIVITFNYRLNVFGFFSMNNKQFPGNNGLRDVRTLLRWVQRNAGAFGGNPQDVTLAGNGVSAVSAHIMSLSEATSGLFRRLMLLSGTAIQAFYSSGAGYANYASDSFLKSLGINSTDPDYIHNQLIHMPLNKIMEANRIVQSKIGHLSFVPTIEGSYPEFTRILDDNPLKLIRQGRGKDIPLIIGFASKECEFVKRRISYMKYIDQIKKDPSLILATGLQSILSAERGRQLGERVMARYFNGTPKLDEYVPCCTDTYLIYPAFKLAQWRAATNSAPVYMYQFSYDSTYNVVKDALKLNYEGGGAHSEDVTFIFRVNSMLGNHKSFPPRNRDDLMKHWMTEFVVNFIKCDKPNCDYPSSWPPVDANLLNYQSLYDPLDVDKNIPATADQWEMIKFFDDIESP